MNKEIICPVLPSYQDERGEIKTIVEGQAFSSVLRISSKAGAVRANHYHKTDYHYCLLESGRMEYYERPVGSQDKPLCLVIKPGQVFYTGPMLEHAMKFLEDSVFWCYSRNSRAQADYESDTVRVKLI
jgi:quercetin dioxygenase-like cupin family protein